MTPINWKEQATEFIDNMDRTTECLEYIKQEVKAALGIEDIDGYPGGLLGALQKICDFKLEDVSKPIDPMEIEDDWREINRQHEQVKFLRMLVIVQLREAAGLRTGYIEPMKPVGYFEEQEKKSFANIIPAHLFRGGILHVSCTCETACDCYSRARQRQMERNE
jgi:hypothetical protein